MPLPELALALLALLVTPGPTNTLLALGGAEAGWRRAARLIPAEGSAYLLTTVPLAIVGAEILSAVPALRTGVTLAAALWVAYLAVRLWRLPSPQDQGQGEITPAKVFTTTLLNPKGLIIGLVLLPAPDGMAVRVVLFAALIVVVASGWAMLGALLRSGTQAGGFAWLPLIRRAGACWLALLSVSLAAAAGIHG